MSDKLRTKGKGQRARALILKEARQMLRDKSTLTLGIILPIVLLLLFGFGLSLDVTLVPVAVVRDSTPETRSLYTTLSLSPYIAPVMVDSWAEAEASLLAGKNDAIIRRNTSNKADGNEHIQIIVNGRDSNKARIMQRYLTGAIGHWQSQNPAQPAMPLPVNMGVPIDSVYGAVSTDSTGHISVNTQYGELPGMAVAEPRIWYNHALESRHFLIPGVTALIVTLIGTLLTALVIAREWERGTFESLLATPADRLEILAGKTVPYFMLGLVGLALCLLASRFLFQVPMRGNLSLIIIGSALYLLVALGIGLFISGATKNQFMASQIALLFSFLPTLMLSGFLFDLHSAPRFVYYLAHIFPATWYVELLQSLFLGGNIAAIVMRDFAILAIFAVVTLALAASRIKKSLE